MIIEPVLLMSMCVTGGYLQRMETAVDPRLMISGGPLDATSIIPSGMTKYVNHIGAIQLYVERD